MIRTNARSGGAILPNKKAFTLIELLAVIVILAIIALIAVPIVLNIIKDSKENATIRSAELYMNAAELAVTNANLETEIENTVCTVQNNGNLSCEGLTDLIIVEINGEKPIDGIITFSKGKKVLKKIWIRMSNNDVYAYKENTLVKLDKSEEHDYIMSTLPPGLYNENYQAVKTWQELIDEGIITVNNGEIGTADATRRNSLIGELIISETVISIGNGAFRNCRGLTSVTIPDSVTSIGNFAFKGCLSLTSVTIGNGVTSIGYFFEGCLSLTSVTIPDSVTSIVDYAFQDCSSLTNITIPNSVTSIGNGAFSGCTGLTSITIPGSVTSIGNNVFRNCTGLTSITIPDGVTSIGNSAFSGCTGLTSITIPDSVTSIGTYAFQNCTGLTSVTIPSSVISISDNTFQNCTGLTSITIPNSVTSIGKYAFQNCTGLTSIFIPSSVTTITSGGTGSGNSFSIFSPFIGCSSSLQISCEAESKPDGWDISWNKYDNSHTLSVSWGQTR